MSRRISAAEIAKHNTLNDLWLVLHGDVWDFSGFVREHPGGMAVIAQHAGKDATVTYAEVHGPNLVKSTLGESKHLGVVDESSDLSLLQKRKRSTDQPLGQSSASAKEKQAERGKSKAKPALENLISTHDFEAAASTSLTPKAWAFVSSAATDLYTKRRNAEAYSLITLRPRVLVDVSSVDLTTTMLGHTIRLPIFCAPTSMGRVIHPEGEKALAVACQRVGIAQVVSTSASFSLEEIAEAAGSVTTEKADGIVPSTTRVASLESSNRRQQEQEQRRDQDAQQSQPAEKEPRTRPAFPLFFQLYMDRTRSKSLSLLHRMRALSFSAVFLTVDAPLPGKREADERISLSVSDAGTSTAASLFTSAVSGAVGKADAKGGALGRIMGGYIDPSLSWRDIPWLRAALPGMPIVLKGIQTWMDAERAVAAGVDAIVVSNHGGRSLDTSPATVLVLLEMRRCCPGVFDKVEVYVDGGIARGTDIFKALCLGARAVGLGRGMLYGLNYGVEGVERYIEILRDELETTMKMCGVISLDQLHPGLLNTRAVDHLIPDKLDDKISKSRL